MARIGRAQPIKPHIGRFSVYATANNTISVPSGSIQLTALPPTVVATANNYIAVPLGTLQLNAKTPTVTASDHKTVAVPSATLNLTAYAPSIVQTAHNYISVPSASLTLQAFAPTVSNGEAVTTATVAGGTRKRSRARPKRQYVVEIDGVDYVVSSAQEAAELLAMYAPENPQKTTAAAKPISLPAITVRLASTEARSESVVLNIKPTWSESEIQKIFAKAAKRAEKLAAEWLAEKDDEEALLRLL
jgi:hypothetical protein